MAVTQGPVLAAVLLLISLRLHCSSPLPACQEPCTCQRAPLLNCSASGLFLVPQNILDSVTELDLSHNLLDSVTLDRPHHNLRNVWLGNNSIARLSLCIETDLGGHHVRGRHLHHLRPRSRHGCVSWAPALQLLSVERNQLEQLPEGLDGSESLQVLQLSFNRISTLQPGDLSHLQQLVELHLQHNLITSLHPQMFQDLDQLRVLDLSFNKLTSLHPLMYLSLRNIGANVGLVGNKWQCDCSMRSLRRRMSYDSSRGRKAWSVVCASPSILSGRDLLQLEEDDLNCFSAENRPEIHQDVTVYSGSEILLSCSTQDSTWWTPSGQASVSQPQAGLLIHDVTERDTGLYVCVSEEHDVVSFVNLQISKIGGARRKTRSLPRTIRQIIPQGTPNRIGEERNRSATQSQLALAVCLSIFFTFLIAFVLGVLARPCIDVLWKRVTNKKRTETNSVSSVEQRQYDNDGYSSGEEPEERPEGFHRERRVTFCTADNRENSSVQYYDTVASGDQESINNDAVIECEAAKAERDTNTAGDSGSENSLRQSSLEENQKDGRDLSGVGNAGHTHKIEYEHIPDPVELEKRRNSSSSSDSSLSDKVERAHTTPKSPQQAEDSVQQSADLLTARKVKVPQISIEDSEIPGFTSEPFADWSPHTKNPHLTDPDLWQENEEQFEFSDSARSMSARSSSIRSSFCDSKLIVAPTSDKHKRDDMSSSSSSLSGDEPTEYTVNSDHEEEEEDIERNHNKPDVTNACLKQDASFQQQIHGVDPIMPSVGFNQGDYRYDTQRHAARPKYSSSSSSSDSDGEDYTVKQEAYKGQGKDKSIGVSDKLRMVTGELDTRRKVEPMPRTRFQIPSLGATSHSNRAPSPPAAYSCSSSSESEVEITDLKVKQNTGRVNDRIKIKEPETLSTDLDHQDISQIKRRWDVRAPSPPTSSSSSESADETLDQNLKQGGTPVTISTVSHDSDKRLPALDLEHIPRATRCIDIKTASPPPDSSSSSDSEDETTSNTEKHKQGQMHMARLPMKVSQTVSHDPQTQWPVVDLGQTIQVKKRLDIKAPSPDSDSSSSSDSEDGTTHHRERPGKVDVTELLFQESQAKNHDPEIRRPALNLEHTTRIKRRLDIKVISPHSDSSSSSDSEDETTHHVKKNDQGKTDMARHPIKVSQTPSDVTQTQWPALDLEHTTRIKRRLDIKAPPPPSDSSSSSDSENETTGHKEKHRPGKVGIAGLTQWPALDLGNIVRIKRRLDIKAPSPASDSSSSSESEDETTHHIKKERPELVGIGGRPFQESQTESYYPNKRWPVLDLEHTPSIKRRLDIKAPSPASDSSSSSDSENETTHHTKKERPELVGVAGRPFQESQTKSHDPETRWPAVDLGNITHIKQRLDIKVQSPASDSSSSSDSEDETTHHRERPGKVDVTELLFQESQAKSHDPEIRWPALNLERTTRIKRRLDIKVISPHSDSSSSSDSEDETTHHMKKNDQGKTDMARHPIKVSQTPSDVTQTQWPALDLEHTTRIKRRLDIKAPPPPSDSSSSSDSENETTGHKEKHRPGKVGIAGLTQWPALDLGNIVRIKRRLDIKAPSPASDSSSSSESEDETTHHIKKERPELVGIGGRPFQESQTESLYPNKRWPVLDLEHTPSIKRRLDIKAPSLPSDSSSSSDSENETTHHTKKERPELVGVAGRPFQESQTKSHDPETRWPVVDLGNITHIKQRLDIKVQSPASDSSSSSDSEDETTHHRERPGKVDVTELLFQESQAKSHDPEIRWPALNLERTTRIKRRLDIKVISPHSDSSSSSDSEDETTHHMKKNDQGKTDMARHPIKVSQTPSDVTQTQWPALDLEHTTRIKRRLDIKAPPPPSDSSSSSDSENETTGHKEKHRPGKVGIAGLTQWPALDLGNIVRIKRRLDVKAPSPASDSSSSSDSEDETTHHIKKERPELVGIGGRPFQESQTESYYPNKRWPVLDLEHTPSIKRRLDIKAPSPASDSSSSSDSEDETTHHTKKERPELVGVAGRPFQESQTKSHDPETRWPAVDLGNITRIKQRLDIKAPSPASDSSSSSDSEDETTHHTKKERPELVGVAGRPFQESRTKSHDPETRWPAVDLGNITRIKQRLDIKGPSPPPDSLLSGGSKHHGVEGKREETIKISPRYSSSSSDEQEEDLSNPSTTVEPDPDSRWPQLGLNSAPHVKRRLDIKAPSPQPHSILSSVSPGSQQSESNSSSSDSEDENRNHAKLGLGVSAISKAKETFIRYPKTPVIHTSHSPKTDHNIQLEKYTVITDGMGNKTASDNINTTPAINPELESRWATMNLGISRFRKRLEITSHTPPEPPNLPSSPPPDSPSSSSSENEDASTDHASKGWRGRSQVYVVTDKEASQIHTSLHVGQSQSQTEEVERKAWGELKSQTSKVGDESVSVWPKVSLTNIPHVRRALDIRAKGTVQKEKTSSSSENETIDLSLDVPRIKTSLNVKAPLSGSSNSSSSSSESENEVTGYTAKQSRHGSNMSGMTDDSIITYKRVIFQASSPPSNSFSYSGQTIDHTNQRHTGAETLTVAQEGPSHSVAGSNASLVPRRVPSMSFDDVVKKRTEQSKQSTDVDLPPETRWTGIGCQLSDLSVSSSRRHLDVGLSSPQQAPPKGSLASSRALDKFDNSPTSTNESFGAVPEDKRERKGLSALKAMSSERRKWDTQYENVDKSASPLFDDHGPLVDITFNYRRSAEDIKPWAKQPLTQLHLSSTSVEDLLDGIPHYRRHDIGGIEPPQEAPPPIPATPPPYEAVGLTWRSPQSSQKQGLESTRSYLQQESDSSSITSQNLADYYDSPNISHV